MRRGAVFLAALLSLSAGAAVAADPSPGRLGGIGANLFGNSFFHFGQPNLKTFPVTAVRVGKLRIDLQHTRLADVQRAFGGNIYEQGSGMGIARWLCYQGPQQSTWFMSNALGGGDFVMMVAS